MTIKELFGRQRHRVWLLSLVVLGIMGILALFLFSPVAKKQGGNHYSWTREASGYSTIDDDPASPSPTHREVFSALKGVLDPELNINIVDLGLIYDITIRSHEVTVLMTLTTPKCPITGRLVQNVRDALFAVPKVRTVNVNLTLDPPWTVDRMSKEAGERLMGSSSSNRQHQRGDTRE